MGIQCYKCHSDTGLTLGSTISRTEDCNSCHADLRCCKMCEFYDQKAYNECREPSADRIVEKEKANFCDYFKLGNSKNNQTNKDDIMAQANSLFKK